jgi:hypothetical protein
LSLPIDNLDDYIRRTHDKSYNARKEVLDEIEENNKSIIKKIEEKNKKNEVLIKAEFT